MEICMKTRGAIVAESGNLTSGDEMEVGGRGDSEARGCEASRAEEAAQLGNYETEGSLRLERKKVKRYIRVQRT